MRQRETIPDRIFDEADEVELIDLPPEDLLARLHAGKIYLAGEVATAVDRFFRKPNLLALRELALRRVADRVEATARASAGRTARGRLAGDRVMVAVGPDEQAEQLVRAGKRMADALDAEWTVVYVETPALLRLSEAERNRRIDLLRLAESLGGETVTLDGQSAAAVIAEYAPTRHATRVLVGSSTRRGWRAWLRPSTAAQLMRLAQGFDVIVIAPAERTLGAQRAGVQRTGALRPWEGEPIRWSRYAWACVTTAVCTALALTIFPYFEPVNIAMVYLLGVVIAGLRFGRGPSVLTAILNVAVFDFCFVPPRNTFAVSDWQYLVTFAVMLTVALVTANLMASVRRQNRVAGARERRTALLYAMSRELAATREMSSMAQVAVRHVAEVFQCQAVVLLPDAHGKLQTAAQSATGAIIPRAPTSLSRSGSPITAFAPAWAPTRCPRRRDCMFHSAIGGHRRACWRCCRRTRGVCCYPSSDTCSKPSRARSVSHSSARDSPKRPQASRVEAESESLRNTLLASISHDLRTPLAVIAGAGSTLAEHGQTLDEPTRTRLARSVESKAREMADLVSNVLDLMRFESGKTRLRRDWQTLDDLVGTALSANAGTPRRAPDRRAACRRTCRRCTSTRR